jgi:hypothetical protein
MYTPEPSTDPPEPKHIRCGKCLGEIYEEEKAYILSDSNKPICTDCFDEFFNQQSRSEKAALIGAEEITVDFVQR